MNAQILIPAAGMGARLGAEGPKALVDLAGRSMLAVTLSRFDGLGLLSPVVVVAPDAWLPLFEQILIQCGRWADCLLVAGGLERQESVARGLEALRTDAEYVVIHDAARPFVSPAVIKDSLVQAAAWGAATVAVPVNDTILVGDADAFLQDTPDRKQLWSCQTPQTFRTEVIRKAHRQAAIEGYCGTDDASLVRRMGAPVKLTPGSPENFKVTTPFDLALARSMAAKEV